MDVRKESRREQSASYSEIAELAYQYYLERGCEPGRHEEDWRRAEAELERRRGAGAARPPSRTVVGVFHSMEQAQSAFDRLTAEGFSREDISFVANKAGASEWTEPARVDQPELIRGDEKMSNIAGDAGIGAAVGGVGGLLLSFAGLAIPGVGPVLAAGPIVAALGGAGIGAAAGGLIGVLVEGGIPNEEAAIYAEGVRRGGILVTVKGEGEKADRAAQILDEHGAVDIDDRVSDWRNRGWTRHDAQGTPLTADELRREREYFSAARRQGEDLAALARNAKPGRGKKKTALERAAQTGAQPEAEKRRSRIYGYGA